jgi:hypothetical protein
VVQPELPVFGEQVDAIEHTREREPRGILAVLVLLGWRAGARCLSRLLLAALVALVVDLFFYSFLGRPLERARDLSICRPAHGDGQSQSYKGQVFHRHSSRCPEISWLRHAGKHCMQIACSHASERNGCLPRS